MFGTTGQSERGLGRTVLVLCGWLCLAREAHPQNQGVNFEPAEGYATGAVVGQPVASSLKWSVQTGAAGAPSFVIDNTVYSPLNGSSQSLKCGGPGVSTRIQRNLDVSVSGGVWRIWYDFRYSGQVSGSTTNMVMLQTFYDDLTNIGGNLQLFQPYVQDGDGGAAMGAALNGFTCLVPFGSYGGTTLVPNFIMDYNHWYRFEYTFDFDQHQIRNLQIFDLATARKALAMKASTVFYMNNVGGTYYTHMSRWGPRFDPANSSESYWIDNLTVTNRPEIDQLGQKEVIAGTSYTEQLSLTDTTLPPVTSWSLISDAPGAIVDSNGLVSGWTPTPAQSGQAFNFSATATNSGGTSEAVSWKVVVVAAVPDDCGPHWLPADGLAGINGSVYATTVWDPDGAGPLPQMLVAGGSFGIAGNAKVSNIAAWDGSQWQAMGSGVNGTVSALEVYGGQLIAAGAFTTAGGTSANRIAAWTGGGWQPLGSGLNNTVFTLAVQGGDLFVGGQFTTAGGTSANRVARWTGSAWQSLGAGAGNTVNALTIFNGALIVGGAFTTAGGATANYIASWTGSAWQTLGTGMGSTVSALTVLNGQLYAGGQFTAAGGSSASRVARWTGSSWQALGTGLGGNALALARYNNDLIVGGSFTTAGGASANYVARWTGIAWQPLAAGVGSTVRTLNVFDGHVIAAGDFTSAGGFGAQHIARWNGSAWRTVGSGFNDTIYTFTTYGDELIAGGSFTTAGNELAGRIARWDGRKWRPLDAGLDGPVLALTVYNGELIAGGGFTKAGGSAASNIARWNGTVWQPLGAGVNSSVNALEVYNGKLIAGGDFTSAGGGSASHIASWNGTSWQPLSSGSNSYVLALKAYAGVLVAGGWFNMAGGVSASFIAQWDGTNWQPLGAGLDDIVSALAVHDGQLVAAGGYVLGWVPDLIARWDGTSWQQLGGGLGNTVFDDRINALIEYDKKLIAAGYVFYGEGQSLYNMAVLNGNAWQSVPGTDNEIFALANYGGSLQVGGRFTYAGYTGPTSTVSPYWGRWRGSTLQPPTPDAPLASVCSGNPIQLTAEPGVGGNTVEWFTGSCGGTLVSGGATPTVTPNATTTYYARTKDSSSGCASSTCASVSVIVHECADGVLAVGSHALGQLGIGAPEANVPTVNPVQNASAVAAGGEYGLALTADGAVWAWGRNNFGQLGDGTATNHLVPVRVPRLSSVTSISSGFSHSLALRADGTVWAWGDNSSGQLGDGSTTDRSSPVQVAGLNDVVKITAGHSCSFALRADGTAWSWGSNFNGELGDGTTASRSVPGQLVDLTDIDDIGEGLARKNDGTVWSWGSGQTPTPVPGLDDITAMAVGYAHFLVLKHDGTVWAWGNNFYGQIGDGTTTDRFTPTQVVGLTNVISIFTGPVSIESFAKRSDGSMWIWGNNANGQLGGPTSGGNLTTPTPLTTVNNVKQMTGSTSNSLAVTNNGSIWAWGYNGNGERGDGTTCRRGTVVQAPALSNLYRLASSVRHSLALLGDGSILAWGSGWNGALGDGSTYDRFSPVQVYGLDHVTDVAAGYFHSLAVRQDGTVWSWGLNYNGELGDGTTESRFVPVSVAGLTGVKSIVAGNGHSLALKNDGTIWAWGSNASGELGNGSTTQSLVPIQVAGLQDVIAIAAGDYHSLALRNDGALWAWGSNSSGGLGIGSTVNQLVPVQVAGVDNIIAVDGGHAFTVALKSDRTVWAWGKNTEGQLGIGSQTNMLAPVPVTALSDIVALSAGMTHAVAVKQDGTAWAWGLNSSGQLGDGTFVNRTYPVQVVDVAGAVNVAAGEGHTLFSVSPVCTIAQPTGGTASSLVLCTGTSVQLTAAAGAGGDRVEWFANACGGELIGTGASLTVTPAGSARYFARTTQTTSNCFSNACVQVGPVHVHDHLLSDLDHNCSVDSNDAMVFGACASGADTPHNGSPVCQSSDFDADGDVDQDDFGILQRCYSTSDMLSPPPGCD